MCETDDEEYMVLSWEKRWNEMGEGGRGGLYKRVKVEWWDMSSYSLVKDV